MSAEENILSMDYEDDVELYELSMIELVGGGSHLLEAISWRPSSGVCPPNCPTNLGYAGVMDQIGYK